jgi:hypothetical protein
MRALVDSFAYAYSVPAIRRGTRSNLHRLLPRLRQVEPRERPPFAHRLSKKAAVSSKDPPKRKVTLQDLTVNRKRRPLCGSPCYRCP